MMERFPYGKAPFVLLCVAVLSSLAFAATRTHGRRADLVVATFARDHRLAYLDALPAFEAKHGVTVEVQEIAFQSLEARLQAAIVSNTEVPDLVEISSGTLGFFTRGPREDFGFTDLTPLIESEGYDQKIIPARFTPWTARGRIYALPHDVHPVMLAYRRDLVEELGIDVHELQTWDDFRAMGERVTRDLDGDGTTDRFALDLPLSGSWGLLTLLLQRGVTLFDARGEVAFNQPLTLETIDWYLRVTRGKQRIAYPAGWGQNFAKAMADGLVLFFLTPDWRAQQYQVDSPSLSGKMALMPLPAWEKGGRRTSTWGMTGLTISKNTKHPELAWELAKFLYFDERELGARFQATLRIPPLETAWSLPEFRERNEFYSGQRVGLEYVKLAPDVPEVFASPIYRSGMAKLDEAVVRVGLYFDQHCGLDDQTPACQDELRHEIQDELDRAEAYLKRWAARHQVLARD